MCISIIHYHLPVGDQTKRKKKHINPSSVKSNTQSLNDPYFNRCAVTRTVY